jgi:hypothetical protein
MSLLKLDLDELSSDVLSDIGRGMLYDEDDDDDGNIDESPRDKRGLSFEAKFRLATTFVQILHNLIVISELLFCIKSGISSLDTK